jgi:hypothetical protein
VEIGIAHWRVERRVGSVGLQDTCSEVKVRPSLSLIFTSKEVISEPRSSTDHVTMTSWSPAVVTTF